MKPHLKLWHLQDLSTILPISSLVGVILVLNNNHSVINESDENKYLDGFSSKQSSSILSIVNQLRQSIIEGSQDTLENHHKGFDSDDSLLAEYGRKKKKEIATWSKDEIKKLEQLVQQYGTDFSILSTKIGKSRDQVKRKFKIMQKKNAYFGFN